VPNEDPGVGSEKKPFRYWLLALVVLLSVLAIIPAAVGILAVKGIAVRLTVGLLLVVVGLVVLVIDRLTAARTVSPDLSERPAKNEPGASVLFALGLALAIGGFAFAITGWVLIAIVSLWVPVLFVRALAWFGKPPN
jgi:hypothetical protein